MFTLDIDSFMLELKDGAFKNVGASNKEATAKLYDVEAIDVAEYGNDRVKLSFEDEDGNEVEVAVSATQAGEVARGIELLEEESGVFE
jgi:hypothetical protein